jgi:chloramphenicol O-acetyltransferase type A
MAGAEVAMKQAVSGDGAFRPNPRDDMIHFTTLPWVSFTSFSHARNWGREDSVPKIAFGKFMKVNERTLLPFSVEVHHALMDGLHVGRYVSRLEEALRDPETFLSEK